MPTPGNWRWVNPTTGNHYVWMRPICHRQSCCAVAARKLHCRVVLVQEGSPEMHYLVPMLPDTLMKSLMCAASFHGAITENDKKLNPHILL
jgi:hypothetical protein